MSPIFFQTQQEFRKWLAENHKIVTELFVGFYKINSEKKSMTWSESVDQAICFGWIDGVKKSIGSDSYQIRFTPRRADSIWSAVNIKKVEDLTKKGLMKTAGLASFEKRIEHKSRIYAFENDEMPFSLEFELIFKKNQIAWEYFQSLAVSYRKVSSHWVMSAKQEITRMKRLEELISDSEAQTNKWKHNKYKRS